MSDPSLSSAPGNQIPKPEAMQHIHHHSLFHPRVQPQGGGQPGTGPASYHYQPGSRGWHPNGHYYRRWRGPSRLVWFLIGAGTAAWFSSRPSTQSPASSMGYRHGWACKTGPLPAAPDSRPNAPRAVDDAGPEMPTKGRSGELGTTTGDAERAILREFGTSPASRQAKEIRTQNLANITSALEGLDDRHIERMSHWLKRFQ